MVHSHDFYRQYQETYEKYTELYGKQVCVFLQKGSFYEFYGQMNPTTNEQLNTGKEIIDILGVQLHTYLNDGPNGTTGYYGGVPVWTLDKWAEKLTKQGWSVIVIDEIKNAAGKVTKREVTRVLSAGTHIDSADARVAHFLSVLWLDFKDGSKPPTFGVSSADLTTGHVILYEGAATGKYDVWHTDDLRHFFQVYPPREIVICMRGTLRERDEEFLRRTLYIPNAPIHTRNMNIQTDGNFEDAFVRETYLREMFQPKTSLPLRVWLRCNPDGSSLQERALTTLLRFTEDHAASLGKQLGEPRVWHPIEDMQIINNALTQLNLIGTGEQTCMEDLFCTPVTAMGKRCLTERLCSPMACAKTIHKRHEEVAWILGAEDNTCRELETCLGLTYDIARLHRSIIRGTIKAADVVQLNQSYNSILHIWDILKDSPLRGETQIDKDTRECLREFVKEFDVEKATEAMNKDGELGFLHAAVAPKTAEAETKVASVYKKAEEWLRRLRTACGVSDDACYFRPTEKNMFMVHVTRTASKNIEGKVKASSGEDVLTEYKKGIEFKSLTSSGRIEHPLLETYQAELDSAKSALSRVLSAELPVCCIEYTNKTRNVWQKIEEWVIHVDISLSMAKTTRKHGWVRPILDESEGVTGGMLDIENLRHPLIEIQKRQSKYVTHNVTLGDGKSQGWLLYGMNASGKSSLMKAIGLCVLLAQVGCFVPATRMRLRPFRRLATRILNQDNLWAGLSSFAVEMSELREILAVADSDTLVLGDELCAGTESISGTAIVAAGIEHLYKSGSRFVLATHLHDLMKIPMIKKMPTLRVWHLHVEYDCVRDILVYHRTLREGAGSTMYGLEVAKALQLPRDMIEAAFEIRRGLVGESAAEDAAKSSWNASVTRKKCESCGSMKVRDLEVHHLEERNEAVNKRNKDGTFLNHIRNLAVLCEECHDRVHSGTLKVGLVEDTSAGPQRKIIRLDMAEGERDVDAATALSPSTTAEEPQEKKKTTKKYTEEQITAMCSLMGKNPGLSPKLWVFQIRRELGLEITEAALKRIRMANVMK